MNTWGDWVEAYFSEEPIVSQLDRASIVVQLAACIAGLRAGRVAPCIDALIALQQLIQQEKGEQQDRLDRALDDDDYPYIWDTPCRPFE